MCHRSTIAARPAIIPLVLRPAPTMLRTPLKSKIHRTAVTRCDLNHHGSCVIDEAQRVVVTPDNRIAGQRFAIPAQLP